MSTQEKVPEVRANVWNRTVYRIKHRHIVKWYMRDSREGVCSSQIWAIHEDHSQRQGKKPRIRAFPEDHPQGQEGAWPP